MERNRRLVLTRKEGEAIVFRDTSGELIGRIEVFDFQRGKIRVAVQMPATTIVLREEIDFQDKPRDASHMPQPHEQPMVTDGAAAA